VQPTIKIQSEYARGRLYRFSAEPFEPSQYHSVKRTISFFEPKEIQEEIKRGLFADFSSICNV
jgi:hypothetical protein